MSTRHSCAASLLLIAALAAGTPALAQTVHRYVTPDGKVIYSNEPVPGAKLEREVGPPPPPISSGSGPGGQPAIRETDEQRKLRADRAAKEAMKRAEGDAAARREIDDSIAALDKAKKDAEAGKEPLPGERIGTAGGASRLTDAYHARQKANQRAVESAQRRVDQAQQKARER